MIDPAEIMARTTVEEICAGAEAYFSSITDPGFHERKPFSSPDDAAELLDEVGLLLRGLHLAPGMRVLDLGAGTAWLSRFLNELGGRVTACDPSKTALEIGRRTNARFPFVTPDRLDYEVFNGRTIDHPDGTFDRVVCFEALHHMPNWEEILGEIHRVLKPGGVAGFAEPGFRHSRSAMSQHEMRNFVVLENDIRLDRIVPVAEGLGFRFGGWEPALKARLDLRDWKTLVDGSWWSLRRIGLALRLIDRARRTLGGRTVFFLGKGPPQLDSRGREGLAGWIRPGVETVRSRSGVEIRIPVEVTNRGTAAWLDRTEGGVGVVALGVHRLGDDGGPIRRDLCRGGIPRVIPPGASETLTVTLPPLPAGLHRFELDLVSEGVAWFGGAGDPDHQPGRLTVQVD